MEIPGITSIECPCGTLGDEKELEFVSAILQTGDKVRTNGTISCEFPKLLRIHSFAIL